ncbi:MAG: ATP-binding protein [Trueperaceae bacterium]
MSAAASQPRAAGDRPSGMAGRRGGFRRRLAMSLALQTVLVLLVAAAALFLVLARFLEVGQERRLEDAAAMVEVHDDEDDPLEIDEGFPANVSVRLVKDGEVVARFGAFPDVPVMLPTGSSTRSEHRILVLSVREDGERYDLQLATDTSGVRAPLRAYLAALAIIVPASALVVFLASGAVAGRSLAPLRSLEQAASTVAGSRDLRQELPATSEPGELGDLARTLQSTFTRLAQALEHEQAFTRAAAHDLRSPLTALITRIQGTLARPRDEAAYRSTLVELERDVQRLARLTEHLLLLGRDERALRRVPVDLVALAHDAVDRLMRRYPDANVTLEATHASVHVAGDPLLLAHLLENLLENAALHGGGTAITAEVSTEADGAAALRVHDEGPGVPEALLPRLTETFFRGDIARAVPERAGGAPDVGSGLGLAIVQRVADLHGASCTLRSAPGAGFEVTVGFAPPAGSGAKAPARPAL